MQEKISEEHPNAISAMNNLARTYYGLEKYADAEKLQINVINARVRVLGEEHPDTISAMGNLTKT